jgi:hypothetical protein
LKTVFTSRSGLNRTIRKHAGHKKLENDQLGAPNTLSQQQQQQKTTTIQRKIVDK